MERIKNLNGYQKGILLVLIAMAVIFGMLYAHAASRVGFLYKDVILVPNEVNGNMVYAGTIGGKDTCFTVTPDQTVSLRYGEMIYGPYTAKEDATAIPEDDAFHANMTGMEVRCGDEIIFRGGIFEIDGTDSFLLVNKDGSGSNITIHFTMSDGLEYDSDGNLIDPMEPAISDILNLLRGPALTSKGEWLAWFTGIFLSLITAVSILYADELFRWNLAFQIRYADTAEPSDWEIAGRYIGWTVLTVTIFVLYILGLQ